MGFGGRFFFKGWESGRGKDGERMGWGEVLSFKNESHSRKLTWIPKMMVWKR